LAESIIVENCSKTFGDFNALSSVNMLLEQGQKYVIQGASGSGKSTLLYLLGGLDRPSTGNIFVFGKKINFLDDVELARYRNETIGFIFQFHFLLPTMNCLDNILLPAEISGSVSRNKVKQSTFEMAELLGVANILDKYPTQLSGGEQQRINILRAISLRPKILLCDEPTGNLDSANSELVISLLRDLSDRFNSMLLIVSHDNNVASRFSRHFLMKDGNIEQVSSFD